MASLRRRPSSPLAGPLEDDDLLAEILLLLPPLPSSLPRASAVSRRWRSLVSDPHFSRRFCAHHRRNPPILGCFVKRFGEIFFEPALEAPNRVPQGSFSFLTDAGYRLVLLGCRHGLVLALHRSPPYQLLVWDPITDGQHFLDLPTGFENTFSSAAVLRAASGDVRHFHVVVVGTTDMQAVAFVYSSDTGVWGNLITMTLSPDDPAEFYPGMLPVMVEDSIYWLFVGNSENSGIIEFDLARQTLTVIPAPVDVTRGNANRDIWIVPAEGGGLGFLSLTGLFCAQLWKRKKDCDGAASWVPGRSIQLDDLLSLNPETEREGPMIAGFAEDNNAVLVWTSIGVFAVQLESLQFQKLFKSDKYYFYIYPYEVVYIAENGIDGGRNGAELLQNT